MKKNVEAVRFLVYDATVNINKKDIFGYTPLQSATEIQCNQIIDMLRSPMNGIENLSALKLGEKFSADLLLNVMNQSNLINCKMN